MINKNIIALINTITEVVLINQISLEVEISKDRIHVYKLYKKENGEYEVTFIEAGHNKGFVYFDWDNSEEQLQGMLNYIMENFVEV